MIYLYDPRLCSEKKSQLRESDLSQVHQKHLRALRPDLNEKVLFLNFLGLAAVYKITATRPLELSFVESSIKEEPKIKTHLYLAAPLGPALEQAVEQATETGYDVIHVLRSKHVQYAKNKELNFSRIKRIVEASCLQCGRFFAPEIKEEMIDFSSALKESCDDLCIFADETNAGATWGSGEKCTLKFKRKISVFIGPEGGWAEDERNALREQSTVFSLGPHILRVPTAVVSAYVLAWKEIKNEP